MHFDRDSDRPSRPVVPSTLAANASVERWLKENNSKTVTDKAGITWHFSTKVENVADPQDSKGILWQATLQAHTRVSFADLTRTGTLDSVEDVRLGHLMEGKTITLEARPVQLRDPTEEGLKSQFVDSIQGLRDRLSRQRLDQIKRQLVAQWIERRQQFATEK